MEFRRFERIRRRAEFRQIYERGIRIHGRYSTVFLMETGDRPARLGIAATRKLGGAIVRNRAKRLIREVFRRNKIARGLDVVIVPKRELLDASLTVLEADYRSIITRHMGRRSGAGRHPRL